MKRIPAFNIVAGRRYIRPSMKLEDMKAILLRAYGKKEELFQNSRMKDVVFENGTKPKTACTLALPQSSPYQVSMLKIIAPLIVNIPKLDNPAPD